MTLKNLIPQGRSGLHGSSSLISLQDRMNDLFNNFFSDIPIMPELGLMNRFPSISVSETSKSITIKAELPAMDEKDIKVEINKDRITISGEKRTEINEKEESYHICELSYGKFSRSIGLPFDVDANKAKASFAKGVLTIEVDKPSSEIGEPQTIPISSK